MTHPIHYLEWVWVWICNIHWCFMFKRFGLFDWNQLLHSWYQKTEFIRAWWRARKETWSFGRKASLMCTCGVVGFCFRGFRVAVVELRNYGSAWIWKWQEISTFRGYGYGNGLNVSDFGPLFLFLPSSPNARKSLNLCPFVIFNFRVLSLILVGSCRYRCATFLLVTFHTGYVSCR